MKVGTTQQFNSLSTVNVAGNDNPLQPKVTVRLVSLDMSAMFSVPVDEAKNVLAKIGKTHDPYYSANFGDQCLMLHEDIYSEITEKVENLINN